MVSADGRRNLTGAVVRSATSKSYGVAIQHFSPDDELRDLGAASGGCLNAAVICCDQHAHDERRLALRYRSAGGESREWTFAALKRDSERLARLLASLGVSKGDRVAGLLPKSPELLITALAVWRLGAVYQTLFTAFGPGAIEYRLKEAGTKVIVTDAANRDKFSDAVAVDVVTANPRDGDHDFWQDAAADAPDLQPVACAPDDPVLIMFTSGTTGSPKALLVPVRAIAAFRRYMLDAIGLTPEDRFWNLADPGWAYGLYYAVIGPLAAGFATTFYDGPFTVESAYATIDALGITSLAGSPTAYRMMIGAGPAAATPARGKLRAVSGAGEPLNPEVIRWFAEHLDVMVLDHYGQTELGMVLCNHRALTHPITVGSAGFASPGYHVAVLTDALGEAAAGAPGMLALDRTRSPLMWFAGYLGRETTAFVGDWYLTGDTCERNEDGSISFVGRSDDVITTSGYRVGPFDVESALLEHEAVLESAVIGKPDAERTEIIKAFVILNDAHQPSAALVEALQHHVRTRLSKHAFPREIAFVSSLPKTPSGKVQRFLLRNQEVAASSVDGGRPEDRSAGGDTRT
jgi:acetyl-CoA synthetase